MFSDGLLKSVDPDLALERKGGDDMKRFGISGRTRYTSPRGGWRA